MKAIFLCVIAFCIVLFSCQEKPKADFIIYVGKIYTV
jgi:hypothetical protein